MSDDHRERRLRHDILLVAHRMDSDRYYTTKKIRDDLVDLAKPREPISIYFCAMPIGASIVAALVMPYVLPRIGTELNWMLCLGMGVALSIFCLLYWGSVHLDYRREVRRSESLLLYGDDRSSGLSCLYLWRQL